MRKRPVHRRASAPSAEPATLGALLSQASCFKDAAQTLGIFSWGIDEAALQGFFDRLTAVFGRDAKLDDVRQTVTALNLGVHSGRRAWAKAKLAQVPAEQPETAAEADQDDEDAEQQPAQEERKKDTDEVADASAQQGGELHGGKGNSAEVQAAAKSASKSERQPAQHWTPAPRRLSKSAARRDRRQASKAAGQGGTCNKPAIDLENLPVAQRHGAQMLANELAKLVEQEVGLGHTPSPRLCGRALVTELVSRRYQIERARKSELQPRCVILAVDVSGSCSMGAGDRLSAARRAAELSQGQLRVIAHANGYVHTHVAGTSRLREQTLVEAVAEDPRHPAALIWMGDMDGAFMIPAIRAQGTKVVYLDDHGKTHGLRAAGTQATQLADAAYSGIGTTLEAATAVRLARKALQS